MADYSYLGSGKVYLLPEDEVGTTGPRFLGNCSQFDLNVTEQDVNISDYTQPGGGTFNEVKRIESVDGVIQMAELSPDNVALAFLGQTALQAASAVSAENHTAYLDKLVPVLLAPGSNYVVTDSGAVTTYVEGTDYLVGPAGITPLSTGSITEAEAIEVSYDSAAADVVQAITQSAKNYYVVFEGLNEARSGKAAIVYCYRMKIGATQVMALLGEDYAQLAVGGKLLKDTSIVGTGLSQYFKQVLEQ